MATYSSQYYDYSSAVPIPSSKREQYSSYYAGSGGSNYSASPDDNDDSYNDAYNAASVTSGVPSYATGDYPHTTASTYADSHSGDWATDSGASASGVDFNEYMQDRFAETFDPIPLDRSLAQQAQTSGALNAKQRELLELQAKAQARLAKSRARFQEGVQDAQEVRANLEWTSKKVSSLKSKASRKHSKEYKKARERYPSPEY